MLHFFSKTKEKQLKISLFYTCTKNLDMIYSSWDIECDRLKLVILGHFLPFYSPKNPKKSKFWKNEKIPGDIILHLCMTNDHHMMYGSWDMECDEQIFFVILDHFLPFYLLTTQKITIFEKWKKGLEISSFYTIAPKIMIICYTGPEIQRMRCNIHSLFWAVFCPSTHSTT